MKYKTEDCLNITSCTLLCCFSHSYIPTHKYIYVVLLGIVCISYDVIYVNDIYATGILYLYCCKMGHFVGNNGNKYTLWRTS